jgi:hypothetical protein
MKRPRPQPYVKIKRSMTDDRVFYVKSKPFMDALRSLPASDPKRKKWAAVARINPKDLDESGLLGFRDPLSRPRGRPKNSGREIGEDLVLLLKDARKRGEPPLTTVARQYYLANKGRHLDPRTIKNSADRAVKLFKSGKY